MNKEQTNIGRMFEKIEPLVDKMRKKYPPEMNIDGFEPALTSDIAEICLTIEASLLKELIEEVDRLKEKIFDMSDEMFPTPCVKVKDVNHVLTDLITSYKARLEELTIKDK